MKTLLNRHPWLAYVVPFAVFMLILVISPRFDPWPRAWSIARVVLMAVVIAVFAGGVLDLRLRRPVATIAVGIGVFVLWILPDQLFPGYRSGILFQNAFTGQVESSLPVEARTDTVALAFRFMRAALIVPIVEELFWRGWLPRWLDRMEDFRAIPLGTFTTFSFVATSVLFALEHGAFWDVGLVAGAIYNWWMIRTKSLGDLIWCHAVTNACLSGWVLATAQWHSW